MNKGNLKLDLQRLNLTAFLEIRNLIDLMPREIQQLKKDLEATELDALNNIDYIQNYMRQIEQKRKLEQRQSLNEYLKEEQQNIQDIDQKKYFITINNPQIQEQLRKVRQLEYEIKDLQDKIKMINQQQQ